MTARTNTRTHKPFNLTPPKMVVVAPHVTLDNENEHGEIVTEKFSARLINDLAMEPTARQAVTDMLDTWGIDTDIQQIARKRDTNDFRFMLRDGQMGTVKMRVATPQIGATVTTREEQAEFEANPEQIMEAAIKSAMAGSLIATIERPAKQRR